MTDLLREVDEAMRQERLEKLWKEYGNYVLGAAVMVVVATALLSGYRAWNDSVITRDTEKLLTLMEDKNFPANLKTAKLDMRAPLRGIALIDGAGAYMKQDKQDEARALFEKAANDSSIPADIRQLGMIMNARLAPQDQASKTIETLAPVLGDKHSPWRPYALMDAAALAANEKTPDFTKAREYLKQIMDTQGLPTSLYGKAHALDQVYALQEKKTGKNS